MDVPEQCELCKWIDSEIKYWRYGCKAFPMGIPNDIYAGLFQHTVPHSGDHGIRFEAGEIPPRSPRTRGEERGEGWTII